MTIDSFPAVAVLVAPHTIVSPDRLRVLWDAARSVPVGDFAELGVFKGGSAALLHHADPSRTLHLFDTFTGLPEPTPAKGDTHPAGWFAAPTDAVLTLLPGAPVRLYVGRFPDTVTAPLPPLAFVHVDADLYASVRDALAVFWPLLVPGGVMVFDDYGAADCRGAKTAVDEWAAELPAGAVLTCPTDMQAMVRKEAV